MDGVWLKMQGKDHKKRKKQELKVAVIYEGWKKDGKHNSRLHNKLVIAGMEKSREFHKMREARIHSIYNADEIGQRVLNGDGGAWIKAPYEPDTVFQLDRFHIYQEMNRKITDKRSQKARELYQYLWNNRHGLLPYQKQMEMPEAPEGIVYKNMGVQENQNCTTVTLRMKNRRIRWSPDGAGNIAKLLCTKENKELANTIDRYTDGLIIVTKLKETAETLSAAKTPFYDGKGNENTDKINHHIVLHDAVMTASRKAFLKIFNC